MPNIASAAKQARKAVKRTALRKPVKSHMLTLYKTMIKHGKKGELDQAKTLLPIAVKAVDMASKRNIIHQNNASRKKSAMQKIVNTLSSTQEAAAPEKKKVAKSPKKKES